MTGRVTAFFIGIWLFSALISSQAQPVLERPISMDGLLVGQGALQSWNQAGLHSYVYVVEHRCHCGVPSPAKVFVENNKVVRVQGVASKTIFDSEHALSGFYTIPGYFKLLKKLYAQMPFSISVKLNQVLGYPEVIDADIEPTIADDEVFYRIIDVKELVSIK